MKRLKRMLAGSAVFTLVLHADIGLSAPLYGTTSESATSGNLLEISPDTGAAQVIGPIVPGNAPIYGLAFDSTTNTLFGANLRTDQLVVVDDNTGNTSVIGAIGFGSVVALAYDVNSGTLFGTDSTTKQLLRIDTVTGAGSAIGPFGYNTVNALAFDPLAGSLYGIGADTSGINRLIELDTNTGQGSDIGATYAPSVFITGLAFDVPSNTLYGINGSSSNDTLISIDPNTGVFTEIGDTGFASGHTGLAPSQRSAEVPVPFIPLLMVSGLLAWRGKELLPRMLGHRRVSI